MDRIYNVRNKDKVHPDQKKDVNEIGKRDVWSKEKERSVSRCKHGGNAPDTQVLETRLILHRDAGLRFKEPVFYTKRVKPS